MYEKYLFTEADPAYLRYIVLRSYENIITDWISEDYLAWKCNERLIVFSLCDGVGLSYLGNLAAEFIGRKFLELLWNKSNICDILFDLQSEIITLLDEWKKEGGDFISDFSLPSNISMAAQNILQYRKEKFGSETVFLCGRIEKMSNGKWQGFFIRMGNVQLQIFGSQGKLLYEFSDDKDENRWSSKFGNKGQTEFLLTPLHGDIKQLLLFSDGLKRYAEQFKGIKDKQLMRLIWDEICSKKNDDITYLDIVFKTDIFPIINQLTPEIFSINQVGKKQFEIIWTDFPGARFEYQITQNFGFFWARTRRVCINKITHKFLQAGIYYIRVRTIIDGKISRWSKTQVINLLNSQFHFYDLLPVIDNLCHSEEVVEWNSVEGFLS